jgi:hypothetical protein
MRLVSSDFRAEPVSTFSICLGHMRSDLDVSKIHEGRVKRNCGAALGGWSPPFYLRFREVLFLELPVVIPRGCVMSERWWRRRWWWCVCLCRYRGPTSPDQKPHTWAPSNLKALRPVTGKGRHQTVIDRRGLDLWQKRGCRGSILPLSSEYCRCSGLSWSWLPRGCLDSLELAAPRGSQVQG